VTYDAFVDLVAQMRSAQTCAATNRKTAFQTLAEQYEAMVDREVAEYRAQQHAADRVVRVAVERGL
jgi:hypothetical protein